MRVFDVLDQRAIIGSEYTERIGRGSPDTARGFDGVYDRHTIGVRHASEAMVLRDHDLIGRVSGGTFSVTRPSGVSTLTSAQSDRSRDHRG